MAFTRADFLSASRYAVGSSSMTKFSLDAPNTAAIESRNARATQTRSPPLSDFMSSSVVPE